MRCITIHQPFAHLIAVGAKRIENRTWKTAYRGPLLIHAGATRKLIETRPDLMARVADPAGLAFGAAVAIVDLVDCVPLAEVASEPYAVGPWCWLLANPTPLEPPVPMRGMQRLFPAPDLEAIRVALTRRSERSEARSPQPSSTLA
jgi:activating signal cointegrator 1